MGCRLLLIIQLLFGRAAPHSSIPPLVCGDILRVIYSLTPSHHCISLASLSRPSLNTRKANMLLIKTERLQRNHAYRKSNMFAICVYVQGYNCNFFKQDRPIFNESNENKILDPLCNYRAQTQALTFIQSSSQFGGQLQNMLQKCKMPLACIF